MDVLGIDVGKEQLHAVLLQSESVARKAVDNTAKGYQQFVTWLKNRKVRKLHVCMEATGIYSEAPAEFLHDAGFVVSVVNPMQIKAFGRSTMVRTKTDLVDALIIAQFCRAQKPAAWIPAPQEVRDFRALLRRRETLLHMITAEKNRLESASSAQVRRSIKVVLESLKGELTCLEKEIDTHLDSHPDLRGMVDRLDEIPGFGALTAQKIVAETNAFSVCDTASQLVAYAGLNPRHYQSGTIKALFYAALSAKNRSPYFRALVERMQAAGKRPKVIITAIMRKLLVLAHALVTQGTRFDPVFAG